MSGVADPQPDQPAEPGRVPAEPGRVEVHHDPDAQSWVLTVDGDPVGRLDTRLAGEAVVAHHTEVDPAVGGRGLGNRLVAAMLADLRRRGLRVVPVCSFVDAYLRRHPEDADLRA